MSVSAGTLPQVETARLRGWRKPVLVALLLLVAAVLTLVAFRPIGIPRAVTGAALWLAGFRSECTQVGPYLFHYFVGGEDPLVLLVHGLGSRARR